MGDGVPAGAVGASVGVLVYSLICLTLCTMVVGLLFSYGERWSYITILATFSAISTLVSMIQQLHYATSWKIIKQAQYEAAILNQTQKGTRFEGIAGQTDFVLFYIQFYCYNVMSLSVLWWAVRLFCGSWGFRGNFLGTHVYRVAPASKIFAVVWPGFIIGFSNIPAILEIPALWFILNNVTMFLCLSIGSILLILILYKYMKTRRLVMGSNSAQLGGWWGPSSGDSTVRSQTLESGTGPEALSDRKRSIYDRALLIRFSIAFVILAIFEVAIIIFSIFQVRSSERLVSSGAPNFEIGAAISEIMFFVPGVTTSLVVYLVFGTTKSFKQYAELVKGCCGLRRKLQHKRKASPGAPRALEFDRLESISNGRSIPGTPVRDDAKNGRELESRVRYFSTLSSESIGRTSLASDPMSNRQSGMREAVDLHSKLVRQPSKAGSGLESIGFIDGKELRPAIPASIQE